MKTLMKKVGGCKKARFWNMARFQTRRWHREQAAAAGNQPHARTTSTLQDAALPPSPRPPLIQPSTNPPIQPLADLAPSVSSHPPSIQESTHPTIQPDPSHPPILPSSNRAPVQQSTNPEIQRQAHPPIPPPVPPLIHASNN